MRELDAWICEHVFGWHRQKFDNGHSKSNHLVPNKFRADKYRKHGWHDGMDLMNGFPNYSKEISSSMEVFKVCVDRLENERGFTAVEKYSDLEGFQGWKVSALFYVANHGTFRTVQQTLPLAICVFAKQLFSQTTPNNLK